MVYTARASEAASQIHYLDTLAALDMARVSQAFGKTSSFDPTSAGYVLRG